MNIQNFEDNKSCEYVGDSIAYLDTGSGLTGAPVGHKIEFTPVGELKYAAPPEAMRGPCDQPVLICPPMARKNEILRFLEDLRRVIVKDGLYLGEWPTEDDNDPYHLFDQGGHVVGTLESKLETPDD